MVEGLVLEKKNLTFEFAKQRSKAVLKPVEGGLKHQSKLFCHVDVSEEVVPHVAGWGPFPLLSTVPSPALACALGSSKSVSEPGSPGSSSATHSTVHAGFQESDRTFSQEFTYLLPTKALLSRRMNKSLSTSGLSFGTGTNQ